MQNTNPSRYPLRHPARTELFSMKLIARMSECALSTVVRRESFELLLWLVECRSAKMNPTTVISIVESTCVPKGVPKAQFMPNDSPCELGRVNISARRKFCRPNPSHGFDCLSVCLIVCRSSEVIDLCLFDRCQRRRTATFWKR